MISYLGAVFAISLAFCVFLLMYLAAESAKQRRWLALATIVSLLAVCLLSLPRFVPPKDGKAGYWTLNITQGLDLQGGTQFTIELQGNPTTAMRDEAIEVIRHRIDGMGLAEPLILPVAQSRIQVQIAGKDADKRDLYRAQLSKVAKLEFHMVYPDAGKILQEVKTGQAILPFDAEILKMREENKKGETIMSDIVLYKKSEMSGKYVQTAYRSADSIGRPTVIINFNTEGKEIFGRLTTDNVGKNMAIVLDNEVYSAPVIRGAIVDGSCEISGGNMSPEEAETLSSVLQNPLENQVKILDERSVDPTLGKASIAGGFRASIIGLVLVIVVTLLYYRLSGVLAVFALILNLVVLLGLLAQFGFTLTMPGVAGIVLTIGMAVDGNVLIFERIREELRGGKPLAIAVEAGFDKAFSSIFDANITTVIAAIILFYQGSGPVQGFAITLTLGVLISMFAVMVATRSGFDWLIALGHIKDLNMASLFHEKLNLPFMPYKWVAMSGSAFMIVLCSIVWMQKGEKVYGVDFAGGSQITYSFEKKIPDDQIHKAVGDAATAQYQPTPDHSQENLVVRVPGEMSDKVTGILEKKFPEAGFKQLSVDQVGAAFGVELWMKSVWAFSLGMICIFLYTMWRFEASFALGAIIALVHDVVLALGIFVLCGQELSLQVVGAVLTVAGYSINDTIIIFDRIREGIKSRYPGTMEEVMNQCINLTLSRTLLTSGLTLLAVLALWFFGGVVIHDFAFILVVGIIVGTYSSIFIASPIALICHRSKGKLQIAKVKATTVS